MKLKQSLPVLLGLLVGLQACAISSTESPRAPWFSQNGVMPIGSGRVLPEVSKDAIRVGVAHSRKTIWIGATGPFQFRGVQSKKVFVVNRAMDLKARPTHKGVVLGPHAFSGPVLVWPKDDQTVLRVNRRRYRGPILLQVRRGVMDVIEMVPLEQYLYGVVPREVSASWPLEALKAQAVVSRTYVVSNRGKYESRGYDVSSDVSSQVYGGIDDEQPATTQAVDQTRGKILVDAAGAPIQAFFHASCGGETEVPSYVWSEVHNDLAYFKTVPDDFCKDDPYRNWQVDIKAETVRKALRRAGYRLGPIKKLEIRKRSPSGRAVLFQVTASNKKIQIPSNRFRLALGPELLRSTLLTDIHCVKNVFHFEGHGWGHGVGLCQVGAKGRAAAGQSYSKILEAYYPEAKLVQR